MSYDLPLQFSSNEQKLLSKIAVLEQRLEISHEELKVAKERELNQKHMHDVVMQALENQKQENSEQKQTVQ